MLRDLINHDSFPSVRKKKKKKLIRASHVFKDPPVFPHIGGKLCALTSENGTVQVHYVRRNTVHSLAVLFPRNSFKIYDTMYIRTRPHFECGFFPFLSRFFENYLPPIYDESTKEGNLFGRFSGIKRAGLHSKRKNFVKYILFETLKLVC